MKASLLEIIHILPRKAQQFHPQIKSLLLAIMTRQSSQLLLTSAVEATSGTLLKKEVLH